MDVGRGCKPRAEQHHQRKHREARLLLGGFKDGGLQHLHLLGEALRNKGYYPVIFDFDRDSSQSNTDTVEILASLARFVVAELTGPSVPYELATLVPHHERTAWRVSHSLALDAAHAKLERVVGQRELRIRNARRVVAAPAPGDHDRDDIPGRIAAVEGNRVARRAPWSRRGDRPRTTGPQHVTGVT